MQQAYANRPEIEQSVLTLKNDEITLKAVKNGLLPTVDLYGFYDGAGLAVRRTRIASSSISALPATCLRWAMARSSTTPSTTPAPTGASA